MANHQLIACAYLRTYRRTPFFSCAFGTTFVAYSMSIFENSDQARSSFALSDPRTRPDDTTGRSGSISVRIPSQRLSRNQTDVTTWLLPCSLVSNPGKNTGPFRFSSICGVNGCVLRAMVRPIAFTFVSDEERFKSLHLCNRMSDFACR
jgi:hypothetical protein